MHASILAFAAISVLVLIHPSSAQSPTPTHGPVSSCPAPVGIKNGDFASSEIAPWTTLVQSSAPTQAVGEIVSSGSSQHVFQVKFPAAQSISWYLGQDMGQQCEDAEYAVSFAVNWIGFALEGEVNDQDNFCTIGVAPSYCYDADASVGYYNASGTSGWVVYNYTCKARKTAWADLNVNVGCEAKEILPEFTMQLDSISVGLAKDQSVPLTSTSMAVQSGVPRASLTTTSTSSPTAVQSSSSVSATSVQTSAAGLVRRGDFLTRLHRSCLLLGPVIYQLLDAGW